MTQPTSWRSPKAATDSTMPGGPHAALLIDFDNVTLGIRSDLQTQLRKLLDSDIIKGKVSVQRAYADWRRYPQYIVPLSEASIDLIFAPAFGANKKNATDIRLAIDALELVFIRPEIGLFILLSGDSDFSALVLKLKEYGKYVIGVGLRESSSDLLVQNCDEYYSYSELTGLTKTSDVEHVQRDPWQLVVQAVQKMRESGDVMRSDRLKQVMLSIDPTFAEKDAGFNRFSKFVLEASRRGLVTVTKLENGQHEVDVGPNANVMPASAAVDEAGADASKKSPPKPRRRRGPRRAPASASSHPLTLTETFDLLKEALQKLGAVGAHSTDAEQVRETILEMSGDAADPTLDVKRFPRVLRQAHDAGLIELVKDDGDVYLLKLAPGATEETEATPSEASDRPADVKTAKKRATTRRSKTRKPSSSAARAEDATEAAEAEAPKRPRRKRKTTRKTADESDAKPVDSSASESDERPAAPREQSRRASPRSRRGSKSGGSRPPRSPEPTETGEAPALSPPRPPSLTRSSLGARRGSRRGRPAESGPSVSTPTPGEPDNGSKRATATSTQTETANEQSPPRGSL